MSRGELGIDSESRPRCLYQPPARPITIPTIRLALNRVEQDPMSRTVIALALTAILASQLRADEPKPAAEEKGEVVSLFDGKSLEGWKVTDFAGGGEVKVEKGQIVVSAGDTLSGITWKDAAKLPKDNFEISLQAMKLKGDDFFCGLTFPVGDSHASLILGGWGGTLVGVSSLDGQDASENETTIYRKFDHNKWYTVRVRVAGGKLQAWVDKEQVVDVELKDKRISTRIEVDPSRPLGLATYQVSAAYKDIQLKRLK
jgi:hypothetical protein